jgi:hypothetical protein
MKAIRRFYFYVLSLISIQVVLWAVINLLRTIFSGEVVTGVIDWLAGGIAFVVVGTPIFVLHWTTAQREADQDEDEHNSRIRAAFLYAALLSTGIPISYALMAILNRFFAQAFGLSALDAAIGGAQSHADNLIALAANLIVLIYFWRVLNKDWQLTGAQENRTDVGRLHRYIWMLYGLGLLIIGAQQVLRYIFVSPLDFGRAIETGLATGLTLVVVGLPIWLVAWTLIQRSMAQLQERQSMLRLGVLYILTLGGLGFRLIALGILAANGLRWIFMVDSWTLRSFIDQYASQLSVVITMSALWAYFGRSLWASIAEAEDELRRAALRRIYASILSFAGLTASFLGLLLLLGAIIEGLFTLTIGNLGAMLSDALALLIIGLPLWLRFWNEIQRETTRTDLIGDHARRSVLRKVYLYLALFATVLGTMLSAGWLIYTVLNSLLGQIPPNFWMTITMQLRIVFLFAVFLRYHFSVLRVDGREVRQTLGERKENFPVLVLQVGESNFGSQVVEAIQRKMPSIPVALHHLDQVSLDESMLEARVIVMQSSLAVNPPDALQSYLAEFSGKYIVVPEPTEDWIWVGAPTRNQQQLVRETVTTVLQLSENQTIRATANTSPWSIAAYILASIFIFQLVLVAVITLINIFLN